jgi:NDP-hexose 4-ketoreductase
MQIIGHGFIARYLPRAAGDHPDVVALAAGVSSTSTTSPAEFAREADLVDGTLDRCRAEGKRLVFFSTASASMYGAPGCPGIEEIRPVPQSPYGEHKLALEDRVAASGADHLILRLGHAIGHGQPSHQLLPALVRQVRSGHVRIYQGARRDIIDIVDVMTILDTLLRTAGNEVVNVASGVAVPIEDIVSHIEQQLGVRAEREYVTAAQPISGHIATAKLQRLAPAVARRLRADGYYRAVLDRYVDASVAV